MNSLKVQIRRCVYAVPGGTFLWVLLAKLTGRGDKPDFSGWGMVTHTATPWHNGGGDNISRLFHGVHEELIRKVRDTTFRLTQVSSVKDKEKWLAELLWRHYIVFWSSYYAATHTTCSVRNLVECGVCDGMSSFFAMNAARSGGKFRAFLYDAWAAMISEGLVDSEKANVGAYAYLNVENTKRNLAAFNTDTVFNRGRIPDSFPTSENPEEVAWMHIDLNSCVATTASLDFFYDRILPGGVILFDDYGWRGYHDTKSAIDEFFSRKNGILMPLPTGQAIYFKN